MIKRTDKIYMEIEEFEEYELTSCVRYELAKRAGGNYKVDTDINEDNRNIVMFLDIKIDEDIFNSFRDVHGEKGMTDAIGDALEDKLGIFGGEEKLKNREKVRIAKEKCKHRQGYKVFTEICLEKDCADKVDLVESRCDIKPNFKRELIKPFWLMRVNAEIDLTLPENELIAYVKLLKRAYDKDGDVPKTADKNMELGDMRLDTPKNRACKWADMFFVYDATKCGMKKSQIKSELDNYYYDNPEKATKKSECGIDQKTIKKYQADMEAYTEQIRQNGNSITALFPI